MNYANIKYYDIANGTGVRTSLFVSGCRHGCKGCFNQEAWNFAYGMPFTSQVKTQIIDSLRVTYVAGLSLLGGEPMEPENQEALVEFLEEIKKEFPHKTIWCYTGFVFHRDLVQGGSAYTPVTDRILDCLDVIVDGKFIQEEADISLKFRGSKNQRLIQVKKTRTGLQNPMEVILF